MIIQLYRTLKIPDPEAVTARVTLVRNSYLVASLEKWELYLILSRDSDGSVLKAISDELVNPNKHFYLLQNPEPQGDTQRFQRDYDAKIFVETEDDPCANDVMHVLTERHGIKAIESVRRYVVWCMNFDHEEKRELAEQLAKELFANPSFQSYRIEA
jgi:phosphoribosylformylglycinamidine (FGAM) synthase PurS component